MGKLADRLKVRKEIEVAGEVIAVKRLSLVDVYGCLEGAIREVQPEAAWASLQEQAEACLNEGRIPIQAIPRILRAAADLDQADAEALTNVEHLTETMEIVHYALGLEAAAEGKDEAPEPAE